MMEMERMEILKSLERGEISADKAVSLLKRYSKQHCGESNFTNGEEAEGKEITPRKGHWFKIRVQDKDHNFRFYVPVSLLSLGFCIGKMVVGSKYLHDNEGMRTAQNILNSMDKRDIKNLVQAIRESGKTSLVEVVDENTSVNIGIV